jgi:diguanylate cyclase (GGDEF)-like protein
MSRSASPQRTGILGTMRLRGPDQLPAVVYHELVDMLFSMILPIVGLGVAFVAVAALIALQWGWIAAAFAIAGAIVTIARVLVILGYRKAAPKGIEALRVWERRYAVGNYAFAALLGALNGWVLTMHNPLLHLITVSMVFAFGAGVVARISVRPKICVVSLLLATVPTIAGLAIHSLTERVSPMHAQLFAVEAILVALVTALSLGTVRHLCRLYVAHLTTKHDLMHLAKQDALTGLPNRLSLRERFQEDILAVDGDRTGLAIHYLDLDGFKTINDRHGHPTGDAVLREVSRRLSATIRASDIVARLGGDEFMIVQASIGHRGEAELLARRIIRTLSAPYDVDGEMLRIGVSIGIAIAPEHGRDLERLMACADTALYRAKAAGKGQSIFCSDEDAVRVLRAA